MNSKLEQYKVVRNRRVVCGICNKEIMKREMNKHSQSQRHKIIQYAKNKISDYKTFYVN
jgi:hypothetical protein